MAFIDVADLKTQLNMTGTGNDAELQQFVDAACDVVEEWCGPIEPRPVTGEISPMSDGAIVLGNAPVLTLTGATYQLGGSTFDTSVLTVDKASGVITRTDGSRIGCGQLLVSYTAGYATPPAWAVLAAKIIGAHMWKTQRLPRPSRTDAAPGAADVPGAGYLVPNQARSLMEPHMHLPGFA